MPDRQALARARQLLRRFGSRMDPQERRLLERLLDRIECGSITRREVLHELSRPLRARGLTVTQAMRRLRCTPYYGLIRRLLPDR